MKHMYGSRCHEAFVVLTDMTLILGFLPLLYLFAALPVLRRRAIGAGSEFSLIPGRAVGLALVTGLGFGTTLLAIVTSLVPPGDSGNSGLFVVKVIGGCLLMIGTGLALYVRGRAKRTSALE